MKKTTIFKGAATALITPLNETGIDYERYGKLYRMADLRRNRRTRNLRDNGRILNPDRRGTQGRHFLRRQNFRRKSSHNRGNRFKRHRLRDRTHETRLRRGSRRRAGGYPVL